MKKRLLAILLALTLVVSLMPVGALAADDSESGNYVKVDVETGSDKNTLNVNVYGPNGALLETVTSTNARTSDCDINITLINDEYLIEDVTHSGDGAALGAIASDRMSYESKWSGSVGGGHTFALNVYLRANPTEPPKTPNGTYNGPATVGFRAYESQLLKMLYCENPTLVNDNTKITGVEMFFRKTFGEGQSVNFTPSDRENDYFYFELSNASGLAVPANVSEIRISYKNGETKGVASIEAGDLSFVYNGGAGHYYSIESSNDNVHIVYFYNEPGTSLINDYHQYAVRFVEDGGNLQGKMPKDPEYPQSSHFEFVAWTYDYNAGRPFLETTTVNEDITVYAQKQTTTSNNTWIYVMNDSELLKDRIEELYGREDINWDSVKISVYGEGNAHTNPNYNLGEDNGNGWRSNYGYYFVFNYLTGVDEQENESIPINDITKIVINAEDTNHNNLGDVTIDKGIYDGQFWVSTGDSSQRHKAYIYINDNSVRNPDQPDPPETDEPDAPDVNGLLKNAILVDCVGTANHTSVRFSTPLSHSVVKDVTANGDGTYSYVISISATAYLKNCNTNNYKDVPHRLAEDQEENVEITFTWKNDEWTCPYSNNGNELVIKVTCDSEESETTEYLAGFFVLMPEKMTDDFKPGDVYPTDSYYPNADGDKVTKASNEDGWVNDTTGYIGYLTQAGYEYFLEKAGVNDYSELDRNNPVRVEIPANMASTYLIIPKGSELGTVYTDYLSQGYELVCYQINNSTLGVNWPSITNKTPPGSTTYPINTGKTFHVDCYISNVPVSVIYDPNGGEGNAYEDTTAITGQSYTVLGNDNENLQFTNEGYKFAGWSTTPTGGVDYKAGYEIDPIMGDTILYAVWEKEEEPEPITDADLAGVKVVLDCIDNVGHEDGSYTLTLDMLKDGNANVGPITANEDGTYSCTVAVHAAKFLTKYSSDYGLHWLVEGQQQNPQTVEMTWTRGEGWSADPTTLTFEVTSKPDAPTAEQAAELFKVKVYCLTSENWGEFRHKTMQFKPFTKSLEISEVSYEDGNWTCKVTLPVAPYIEKFNETYGDHTNAGGDTKSKTLILTDEGWQLDNPSNDVVEINVRCGNYVATITAANIIAYTGGEAYSHVVDANGKVIAEASGLPQPGFHITLSADTQKWLQENGIQAGDGSTTGAANLEKVLKFVYNVDGVKREWGLEYVGVYSTNAQCEATAYVYSLTPGVDEDGNKIPVRVRYMNGDVVVSSDDILMNENYVNDEFTMVIEPGELDQDAIKGKFVAANGSFIYAEVKIGAGKLTVLSTTNEEYSNPIGKESSTEITAKVNGSAEFTVNDSQVAVNPEDVHLLVDEVSNNDGFNSALEKTAREHAKMPNAASESFYLDLVHEGNGNVKVGLNGSLTINWPMPANADPNGEFKIVHYVDMDRTDTVGLDELVGAAKEVIKVKPENGSLSFNVESFSPFVLVYETKSTTPVVPPVDDDDDEVYVPNWLNTTDHYAYIVGYEDGMIKPGNNITRAEVATIFFRLLTDNARERFWSTTNEFSDVNAGSWYNNAISTLSNMGIITGYDDGTFKPNAQITRAEFVTIATRFFSYKADYEGAFKDVSYLSWYADYVQAAVDMGLVSGYPDGSFRPGNNITRAEAVTIVNRVLHRVPHEDHLLALSAMNVWPDNPYGTWYYADMQEATNSHSYKWIRVSGALVEDWTGKLAERDWAALESAWANAHSK